jgi:hypothetical protein
MVFTRRIWLNGKLGDGKCALVDEADYWRIKNMRWWARKGRNTWYAVTKLPGDVLGTQMHRYILGLPRRTPLVDHRDGDGLNNRRYNLRKCDGFNNQANRTGVMSNNTSGYAGIHLVRGEKWMASIDCELTSYCLGSFRDPLEAVEVYRAAQVLLFGEFAPVHTPATGKYVGRFRSIAELVEMVREHRSDSSSGVRGVTRHKGRWVAAHQRDGKRTQIGEFDTVIEAEAAWKAYMAKIWSA